MGYGTTIMSLISLLALHVLLDGSVLHLLVPQLVLKEITKSVVLLHWDMSSAVAPDHVWAPFQLSLEVTGDYWRLL